jgi:glucose/arabinose dehydrogenase
MKVRALVSLTALAVCVCACAETAKLPESAGYGPNPQLPEPVKSLIPTVDVASATGWPEGAHPVAAPGLQVQALQTGLSHPRWLHVLPNGDILVAETNGPARPEDSSGLRGWVAKKLMQRAGSGGPSADRITLLRDIGPDGRARTKSVFLAGLHSPFGMALVERDFYVANTDGVIRFPYEPGQTQITAPGTRLVDLPGGTLNHHWTKNLIASRDGRRLYATVGSNSNVAENGMQAEEGRAAIWEIDRASGTHRVYASGLRNPNGMGFEPRTGTLWTAVNERDELGSDLVPDYMTSVRDGGFYGWPYSYYGRHVDERVQPPRPDLVARALVPDYALGSHTASLGLAFSDGARLTPNFANGVFIGQHGSWNRKPRAGYKVIFIPFVDGKPQGMPVDVLTGFVDEQGHARGRPVGVAIARDGALLVADDVGGAVWRVTAAP